MYLKKCRHKPLYKKFISLRQNVQNRTKLFKFKKRKWQNLILRTKRLLKQKRKNFKLYDHNKYFIPKFNNSFKKKYKYKLETKKKISLFYGSFLKKHIKKQINFFLKNQNLFNKNLISLNFCFVELFEKRLDIILYRAHLVLSVRNARQIISHKHVYINNKVVNYSSYKLKNGDFIELNLNVHFLINNFINKSSFWPLPPKYLHINYKTLQIFFLGRDTFKNTATFFPFWFDTKSIIKFYR